MGFDRIHPDIAIKTSEISPKELILPEETLSLLAENAFSRISFTFTREHLERLITIVNTDENSYNDRLVASMLLENALISGRGTFALCQDTGIANIFAWKDDSVKTRGNDYESLSSGVAHAYTKKHLRFSTTVPSSLFEEKDPKNNLPAQIMISSIHQSTMNSPAYRFLFCAKGGGSSNKTAFFQGTKALLNKKSFKEFLEKQIPALGTAACPPYTIAVVVGGLSPEQNLLTLKLATTGYFDEELPGWDYGVFGTKPLRDREWEQIVLSIASRTGLGAQFGGKAFAIGSCVLRLPRHGASCPVSIGVSCSAHRNLHGYIDNTGIYLEQTVEHPLTIPGLAQAALFSKHENRKPISINLDAGLHTVRSLLASIKPGTPVLLSGKILVARDAAHARWHALIENGKALPSYLESYAIFYAGPAETPPGEICGSIGPTTAGRMDEYADELMSRNAALITLAKGNRGETWRKACEIYKATYLGTVGGAAALIADAYITDSVILDFVDLGMEAVRLVTVFNLPAFVLINDKGEDFYTTIAEARICP